MVVVGDSPGARDPRLLETLVADCIEALDSGEDETAVVARVCDPHPDLAPQVRAQLEKLRDLGILRATRPAELPAAIGPYRVLAEIGQGGMGSVLLAEQREPVRRQVALKVIKPGMDTREVVARFQAERQALALMSHPNVAQVYDVGSTPDGRPYFVMEFVPGEPITTYCDRKQLGVTARLDLFAAVCRGVQHAHDRGIIHRDLKPSNVLIAEHGAEASPKIIDFGIAKAIGPDAGVGTMHTRVDQLLGTPEYMSPEQARTGGVDVDVRTDVYSLGVVLYELLAGELPFPSQRLRAGGLRDLERILTEETPSSPSTRVSARAAAVVGSTVADLRRRLRGELDWIVGKALEKDKARRYASPLALAEDIERHLRHEPIAAGPPSTWYRVRKLVRRHRVEATAGALIGLSLLVGLAVSLRFYVDARDRAREAEAARVGTRDFYGLARQAIDRMLVRVADDRLEHVPQAEPVRRALLEDALDFYRELEKREPADASLQGEVAYAQANAASIYRQLGRLPDALAAGQQALELLEVLLGADPGNPRLFRLRAMASSTLARVRANLGEAKQAEDLFRSAIVDLERADVLDPGGADPERMAAAWNNLGLALVQVRPEAARDALARAVALQASLPTSEVGAVVDLAQMRASLGMALAASGDTDGAVREQRSVIAALNAHAGSDRARPVLAHAHASLGEALLAQRDAAAAIAEFELAADIERQIVRDFPSTPALRDQLAGILNQKAGAQQAGGDLAAAVASYREAVAIRTDLVAVHPEHAGFRSVLVRSICNLSGALLAQAAGDEGALTEAMATARHAVETAEPLLRLAPEDIDSEFLVATSAAAEAVLHLRAGEPALAAPGLTRAREMLERLVPRAEQWLELRHHLASASEHEAVALALVEDPGASVAFRRARTNIEAALELRPQDARLRAALRSVFVRSAETALRACDQDLAASLADELATSFPEQVACQVVAGEFLARCGEGCPEAERREAFVARALKQLGVARRAGFEPPEGWPERSSYAWLRDRPEFAAALR